MTSAKISTLASSFGKMSAAVGYAAVATTILGATMALEAENYGLFGNAGQCFGFITDKPGLNPEMYVLYPCGVLVMAKTATAMKFDRIFEGHG